MVGRHLHEALLAAADHPAEGGVDPAGPPAADPAAPLDAERFRELREIFAADALADFVERWCRHAAAEIATIRNALASGDRAKVATTAHALCGGSQAVAAQRVAALASALEHAALDGHEPLAPRLADLEDAVAVAATAVREQAGAGTSYPRSG